LDGQTGAPSFGIFPRHPDGPMRRDATGDRAATERPAREPPAGASEGIPSGGEAEPLPLASGGRKIVLAPEDPTTRVSITSDTGPLELFDARNRAQNGWFVVRTLIPANRTENALVWHVHPNVIPNWIRPPVVTYNQVGYTPERYKYATFDFSAVNQPGIYAIEYAGKTTSPFRISKDVYKKGVWQPSLDTYLAVQMDHVRVRENYRVWHGVSHMDDARQAPVNYTHFDGYSMGANMPFPGSSSRRSRSTPISGMPPRRPTAKFMILTWASSRATAFIPGCPMTGGRSRPTLRP
jgi:endoglucanase